MRFKKAITRRPGVEYAEGITTQTGGAPHHNRIAAQHEEYVVALRGAGLEVVVLEPLAGFPDAYFVEDTAVFLDDVAVLTLPGAAARRGEVGAIEHTVAGMRPVARIVPPGTLDGGDVLIVGRHAFIGISGRTNRNGAEQLGAILHSRGYAWRSVPVGDGLHLKSFVTGLKDDTLLVAEGFPVEAFEGFELVIVPASEAYAANSLRINDVVLTPAGYPKTRRLIERTGLPVVVLDVSEVRRMDGGLTCMSLRF